MRWIFRIVGFFVTLALVALVSLFFLPGDRIARIAADQISAQTGRQVTLSGETKISIWPVLGVATGRMEVANARWSDAGPMFAADSLKIGVDMAALLGGSIRITGLEAERPTLRLERARDGRVNWELGVDGVAQSGQPANAPNALALRLDRALITDAAVSYTDHSAGTREAFEGVNFDMRWPDPNGAADIILSAAPYGKPVRLTARVDDLTGAIAGQAVPLTATAVFGGASAQFSGKAGQGPNVAGKLRANLPDTAAALAALGVADVDIPRGLGRSLTLDTALAFGPKQVLNLRDMALGLDGNALSGALDIALAGAKPRITGRLAAGPLDLRALAASDGTAPAPAGSGWSKARIDASGLAAADAEVSLSAPSVDLGQFRLGAVQVLITNDRSRAVIDIREMRAYGGNLTGDFVINNRSGLSVGGRLSAAGVDMQALLTAAAGINRFRAAGDAQIEFLGAGASLDAIMRSLRGSGSFGTGRGVIEGIDLDRLMRGDMAAGGTTVFDKMGASFTMQGGVLSNTDLSMALPYATASGAGRIDLGGQTLDYTVTPVALQARDGKGLAVPVRVRGPWASPKISIDLEAAVKQNFDKEIDAAKDKAREKVNDAVAKELGVQRDSGESVEDAVKRQIEAEKKKAEDEIKKRLEDKLKKGLGGLLKQ